MPQEFIPRSEAPLYGKQFELITVLLDYWAKENLPESWISDCLDPWFMPNAPIRSEN